MLFFSLGLQRGVGWPRTDLTPGGAAM